ncbi:ImmA/IrrE family metallo-endopeptidase [Halonatronum saccharophilum]|uniref:ImmA/IrrE family metallo-endopeptidase n=1 Tax=Halonatronum saccharophilum TaxID=150060 RepID=UPI0004BB263E|nr:ImmA/IrrE family metallo-endopeptidase [Halonatronum saccharophilum]
MEGKFKADMTLQELLSWANSYDIYPRLAKLGPELWGYTYKSSYDSYLILINKNLSLELQRKVLAHEIHHVLKHSPAQPYFIGLNMQHTIIEEEADQFAIEMMAAIQV